MPTLFHSQEFQPGTYTSHEVGIPNGDIRGTISAFRDSWPATGNLLIEVNLQGSIDNGQTWFLLVGFGTYGGEPSGVDSSASGGMSVYPHRKARAEITVYATLTTEIKAEFADV